MSKQVVRHVLARHDPLRCAESAKRSQRREGQFDHRAVRFRGNELLGLVAVGGMEVRCDWCRLVSLILKRTANKHTHRKTGIDRANSHTNGVL